MGSRWIKALQSICNNPIPAPVSGYRCCNSLAIESKDLGRNTALGIGFSSAEGQSKKREPRRSFRWGLSRKTPIAVTSPNEQSRIRIQRKQANNRLSKP